MTDAREKAKQATNNMGEAAREGFQAAAETTRRTADLTNEGVRRTTDQFTRFFGFAGEEAEALTRKTSENLGAVTETTAVLAQGFQDVSREWWKMSQDSLRKNIEAFTRLSQCRSMQDFVAVQSELARDTLQQLTETSRRVAERSLEAANQANQKLTSTVEGMRRAA